MLRSSCLSSQGTESRAQMSWKMYKFGAHPILNPSSPRLGWAPPFLGYKQIHPYQKHGYQEEFVCVWELSVQLSPPGEKWGTSLAFQELWAGGNLAPRTSQSETNWRWEFHPLPAPGGPRLGGPYSHKTKGTSCLNHKILTSFSGPENAPATWEQRCEH